MRYSLFIELQNLFENSCDLTENECMLLQDALELAPYGQKNGKRIKKQNDKEQEIDFYSEGHYTLVEVKQPLYNNGWNYSSLVAMTDEKHFSGNVYAKDGGVYYYEMTDEGRLKVKYYDLDTMTFLKDLDDIEYSAVNIKILLKMMGILPDKEVDISASGTVGKFVAFAKDPEGFCKEVISWSENKNKQNQQAH